MRRVVVLLLEGFRDDDVVVRVDAQELARRNGVSTQLLTGLAEELRLDVPDRARSLTVALPGRGVEATATIPEGDKPLLVDLEGGALTVRPGTGSEGVG